MPPAMETGTTALGDAEISAIAALLGDRARCRILMALNDGRALPASILAGEAGISPSTASSHLGKLEDAGLLLVEQHGRHRYYRLAGPLIGDLIELLSRIAPAAPARSLREGTRAAQLRAARTCYDHLAGRLGVQLLTSMLERGLVTGGDGRFNPRIAIKDQITGYGRDIEYSLTSKGREVLTDNGVIKRSEPDAIRYCIDWSEQRHHLSGILGRAILSHLLDQKWVERRPAFRALHVTDAGIDGLWSVYQVAWPLSA